MTTPDPYEKFLAKVDAGEAHTRELIGQHGQLYDSTIELMLAPYRALRVAVEMCSRNGYTTWDKSMVPLASGEPIDGKYDKEATKKWELAHGHDIRLKCYPEFGCQLSIDPEDLLLAVAKELGVVDV